MELPTEGVEPQETAAQIDPTDSELDYYSKDAPLVLERLLPGYTLVGEPYKKPNGNGSVRIYAGIENLGELTGHCEPDGKFAIVVDTNAEHYSRYAKNGAVCFTHHMDEREWLIWTVNTVVEGICELENNEKTIVA